MVTCLINLIYSKIRTRISLRLYYTVLIHFLAMQMHIDNRCNSRLQFICKTNINDVHPDVGSGDPRGDLLPCDQTFGESWHESSLEPGKGHYCFKIFNTKVDWYEAEYWCAWHAGGHLTSIHSAAYGDLVHSVAMNEVNTNKYWIGKCSLRFN